MDTYLLISDKLLEYQSLAWPLQLKEQIENDLCYCLHTFIKFHEISKLTQKEYERLEDINRRILVNLHKQNKKKNDVQPYCVLLFSQIIQTHRCIREEFGLTFLNDYLDIVITKFENPEMQIVAIASMENIFSISVEALKN